MSKRFMTKTKANAGTRFLHRKTNLPIFSSRKTSSATCILLPLLLILLLLPPPPLVFKEYTTSWVYRPQFPQQSVLHFPSSRSSIMHLRCATYMYTPTPLSPPFLLLLHGQDHCNTSFSTHSPLDHSLWLHHLKPPFRFLIGNDVISVSTTNASSLTLYFLSPYIWDHRI